MHHRDATAAMLRYYYRTVYHIGITLALLFVIPLPTLLALNIRLMRTISKARQTRRSLTQGHNRDKGGQGSQANTDKEKVGVTVNVVVLVTVFVVCETPDFIASVINLAVLEVKQEVLNYFLAVKELLLVINASTNFFIYVLFYRR